MPPVAVAVVAAAASYAVGTSITVIAALGAFGAALAGGILGGLVSFAGNALLAKKPKGPAFDENAQGRLITVRNPISPQRLIYGQARVGGAVVFEATHGSTGTSDPNTLLYMVTAFAGHEVEEIGDLMLDDQVVPLTTSGVGLIPSSGRYFGTHSGTGEPWVYVEKYLGTTSDAASALLVSADVGWTSAHQGKGIAKVVMRLVNSFDIWPTGLPNPTVVVKGKKVYDPRTATTVWSDNWALCMADYLTDTKFGLGVDYATRVDEDLLIAAANVCDEIVDVTNEDYAGTSDGVTLDVTITTQRTPRIGERFSIGGSTYYCASIVEKARPSAEQRQFLLTFADTIDEARAGTTTSIASGSVTATRTGEPRYTCNGVIDAGTPRGQVIDDLRTAGAGFAIPAGGKWRIYAGAWRAPTVTLTESDLRGPVRIQTRRARRDNCNGVKGVFVDPSQSWQPTDYPAVTSATYVTEDNGEEVWRDLDLPFTTSASMAQRIAKIALERTRRQITASLPCKLTAFRIATVDTVNLTLARYGWSAKTFECGVWKPAVDQDDAGNPTLGVDLTFAELDEAVFAWTTNDEAPLPAAPQTNLPNPFTLDAPGVPSVTEEQYATRDGAGVKVKAIVSWVGAADGFADLYQPEYRLVGASNWSQIGRTPATTAEIFDIAPGVYEFRVKAINSLGVSSDFTAIRTKEIVGLGARPADVTGLTASVISSIVLLQWTAHPDLDVKIGGHLWVRWSAASSGATWDAAVDVGEKVDGNLTLALVPAQSGTYLVKAVDSSGNTSATAATVVVVAGSHFAFTTLDTITESPTFPGTKTSVAVDSSKLHLTGNTQFDDIADLDAVPDVDIEGGISTTGTYLFNSGYDNTTVGTHRIAFSVTAATVNTLDTVDSRGALVDDWEDFDGAVAASAGVRFYVRQTDDDPAGTPTWSAWQRVSTIGDFTARAYEFKAELYTDDPAYDVEVSALSVTIKGV